VTTPCTRWDAAADKRCGGTPTRLHIVGHRCAECTPAALAGRPEPGQGAYCAPLRHYCPDGDRCATWTPHNGGEAA
jgi:formate-dependent phosphoribosylglycinamide formyltransferase (GAR transformylase)